MNCENPKYHVKDNANLTWDTGTSTFARLSPEHFHKLTTGKKNPSEEELEMIRSEPLDTSSVEKAMCNHEPIDAMTLTYNQDREKITSHEGRMRAEAAKEVGKEKLPVKIYCEGEEETDDGRVRINKESCNIRSGLDLVRNAEPQNHINTMDRFNQ